MATSTDDTNPLDDGTTPPAEPPTDATPEEIVEKTPTRFAVYDNTLLRFVSGVVDTYDDALALADLCPESHDVEVREV